MLAAWTARTVVVVSPCGEVVEVLVHDADRDGAVPDG